MEHGDSAGSCESWPLRLFARDLLDLTSGKRKLMPAIASEATLRDETGRIAVDSIPGMVQIADGRLDELNESF